MSNNLATQSGHSKRKEESDQQRKYEKPVAWLLGRQLLSSLQGTLLYAAYGRKLDPRRWMQASVWRAAHTAMAQQRAPEWSPQPDDKTKKEYGKDKGEFWFDYIADTGDGMRAVYSVAYLAMSDLWTKQALTALPDQEAARRVNFSNGGEFATRLPRGQFLIVGGDTAYHVSDYMTLAKRLQQPFKWACEDLHLPPQDRRPLFGIPGNHDYYDQLDGFQRQFRHPVDEEPRSASDICGLNEPQLVIPGFYRAQEASYIALQLPFNWWFWGLDTEVGQIDPRQQKFFNDLCPRKDAYGRPVPPDKLVVATCAPTTVFGKIATEDDKKAADALSQIGLSNAFLPNEKTQTGAYDFRQSGDGKLNPGQCLLEISGDVHHYARYWGPESGQQTRAGAKAEAPKSQSYASVVSGIGGAFHHPSATFADEVREQVLYPSEDRSRQEVARRIFKLKTILGGGYVWLVGSIVAFTLYFASALPQSSREFLNPLLSGLGLAENVDDPITPTVLSQRAATAPFVQSWADTSSETIKPFLLWRWLGAADRKLPAQTEQKSYLSVYEIDCEAWPWDYKLGRALLLGSLIPIVLTFVFSKRFFGAEEKETAVGTDDKPSELKYEGGHKRIVASRDDPEVHAHPDRWLWPIIILTALMAFVGLFTVEPYRAHIPPFDSSLLILFSIIWAVAAGLLSMRYSEFLFKKACKDYIHRWDWLLPSVLSVISVLSVALGLWAFGRDNLPALVVSDIFFIIVAVGVPVAVILVAPFKGGELQRWPGKVGMVFIGIFHALLQMAFPFLLVMKGTLLTWLCAIALVYLFGKAAESSMSSTKRLMHTWGLLGVWIVFGMVMLWLAYSFHPPLSSVYAGDGLFLPLGELAQWWPTYDAWWTNYNGLLQLWVSFVAGVVGALMCCVWVGWYLGVCLGFNGHNNEVGGAVRIENFKQFIRFRLTEDSLTAYVVAVDDVSMIGEPVENGSRKKCDGSHLAPYLIDVFQLKEKP